MKQKKHKQHKSNTEKSKRIAVAGAQLLTSARNFAANPCKYGLITWHQCYSNTWLLSEYDKPRGAVPMVSHDMTA